VPLPSNDRLPRAFYTFQLGIVLGYFALRVGIFAASWWCLQSSGNPMALAGMMAAATAVEVLVGPLSAPFGERHGARLISWSFHAQALCFAVLAFCGAGGFGLVLVSALVLATIFADATRDPVADALLPAMVGGASLTEGVRVRRVLGTLSHMLAPAIGGAVTALVGVAPAFVLAACAVLAGAAMCRAGQAMASVDVAPGVAGQAEHAEPLGIARWWGDTLAGFRCLSQVKPELCVAIGLFFLTFALSSFVTLLAPLLAARSYGAWVAGLIDGAFGAGLGLGALWLVRPLNRWLGPWRTVLAGALGCPLAFTVMAIVIALAPPPVWIGITTLCAMGLGLATVLISVNLASLRVGASPAAFRTRIMANTAFVASASAPLGFVLVGWLSLHMPAEAIVALFAACALVPLALYPMAPHLRQLVEASERDRVDAYAKLYPEAFGASAPR